MKYFIKLWPDKTATLVTNHGKTLMVFDNIEEAQRTLRNLTTKQMPQNASREPSLPIPYIPSYKLDRNTGY